MVPFGKAPNTIDKYNLILKFGLVLVTSILLQACQPKDNKGSASKASPKASYDQPIIGESNTQSQQEKYETAKKNYLETPNDPDALIWYGRRTAYLGNYKDAIDIYTAGINLHPQDARMYRHRGHRHITLRQYDDAILDFEKAVTIITDQEDRVEPDGLPNDRNIPIGTLHSNVWYHLGLAYYLKNDMPNALRAFSNRTVTEKYDDNIVSGGHWLYMILSRMGQEEAAIAAIDQVHPDMDIIENHSYYNMCLFYKGLITEDDLNPDDPKSSASNVLTYGLGNWYLYKKQDTIRAKQYYEDLLKNGNEYSFAFLAAESDWERIYDQKTE